MITDYKFWRKIHGMCVFFSLTECVIKYPQYNTAADIVKVRKSTKSHVSTSLKLLEDKGLVEKKQSEDNKKHIEIFLLHSFIILYLETYIL